MPGKDIQFEITQHLGNLSAPSEKGWTKELNLVSWNGGAPKYDIRDWSEDHGEEARRTADRYLSGHRT